MTSIKVKHINPHLYAKASTNQVMESIVENSSEEEQYQLVIAVNPTRFDKEELKLQERNDSAEFWDKFAAGHVASGIYKIRKNALVDFETFGTDVSIVPGSVVSFRRDTKEIKRDSEEELQSNIGLSVSEQEKIERLGTAPTLITVKITKQEADMITQNYQEFLKLYPEYKLMENACGHAFYYALTGERFASANSADRAVSPQRATVLALERFFEMTRTIEDRNMLSTALKESGLGILGTDMKTKYPQNAQVLDRVSSASESSSHEAAKIFKRPSILTPSSSAESILKNQEENDSSLRSS